MVMNEPFGLREAINGVIRLTQIGLRENNLFSRLNADSLDFYIGDRNDLVVKHTL